MTAKTIGINSVRLVGDPGPFEVTFTSRSVCEGVEIVQLDLRAAEAARPGKLEMVFKTPCVDMYAPWAPLLSRNRALPPDWTTPYSSSAATGAPVVCLFSGTGRNRVTVALSDALRPARMRANISEETGSVECGAVIFENEVNEYTEYSVSLRIDRRGVPYYQSLDDVRLWWEQQPGYEPAAVPEIARSPMYSTWYSFHQEVSAEEIEKQCRLAKDLGCKAVIVDDGWQCADINRGYAFCGDWEVYKPKIPDMAGHVRRVHDLGMKYLLWYSVPFVGRETAAWRRFEQQTLRPSRENPAWAVLDPRYPEVREYLIGIYEAAVRDWDLDGFKLDFVDAFYAGADPPEHVSETDYKSVPEAVDRLLTDVIQRLRTLKPDICIEFRQPYIGPLMRKYGNMFRSGDCPVDIVQNRVNTVDIRLLCGNTAAHTDMVMWHKDEPVESAALQMLNGLFAVPQLSVRIDTLPDDHREMIRFWLRFFQDNRDLLLHATIEPLHPETLYPQVSVRTDTRMIAACYGPNIVTFDQDVPGQLIVVNGTRTAGLLLAGLPPDAVFDIEFKDCRGIFQGASQIRTSDDPIHLDVPPAGLAYIIQQVEHTS